MYVIKMGKKLADILRIVGWKFKIKEKFKPLDMMAHTYKIQHTHTH